MTLVLAGLSPHPPLLLPELGGDRLGAVRETQHGLERLSDDIARVRPDRLVVITPHGQSFADAVRLYDQSRVRGDFSRFGYPDLQLEVEVDRGLTRRLLEAGIGLRAEGSGASLDHGLMVPLYYLRRAAVLTPVVLLCVSQQSVEEHYRLGIRIKRILEEEGGRTVVVASGDLSHRLKADGPYGFDPSGPKFDQLVCSLLEPLSTSRLLRIPSSLERQAGVCATRPLMLTLGLLGQDWKGELLSYQGPFGVGYAVARFEPPPQPIRLARLAIQNWVLSGRQSEPSKPLTGRLAKPAAAFVTVRKEGKLRGCIGTVLPTQPTLAEEIMRNAVGAVARDSRFAPVRPDELELLTLSVSALESPQPVRDPDQLEPKCYGVVVSQGSKRGLLLPDIEGIDSVEKQLAAVRRKARIEGEFDTLERFEVYQWG